MSCIAMISYDRLMIIITIWLDDDSRSVEFSFFWSLRFLQFDFLGFDHQIWSLNCYLFLCSDVWRMFNHLSLRAWWRMMFPCHRVSFCFEFRLLFIFLFFWFFPIFFLLHDNWIFKIEFSFFKSWKLELRNWFWHWL